MLALCCARCYVLPGRITQKMEFKKTWSRMGNAPSKIPLKFGADPGILIRGGGIFGCTPRREVATQQIFSRRIYWRNIWNRALTQRQEGAAEVLGSAGKPTFTFTGSQHYGEGDAGAKRQSAGAAWARVREHRAFPLSEKFMSKISEHGSFI